MKTLKIFGIILLFAGIGTAGYFVWVNYIHPKDSKMASEKADSNIAYYHCGMHPQITSDKPGKCPICGMDLTPVYKTSKNSEGIVIIDPTMVQNIGVKTEMIMKRKLTHTIRTTGIVDYDEEKQTVITTKFSGYIEKLYVDFTGKAVEKGQALFEIYSPELVAAQQEYVQAIHYHNTMRGANDTSVSTGANNLLESAKKKLMYWDISDAQIQELEKTGTVKKTLTVYSPFSGVVIEKDIYEGMQVQAGMNLLKLADVSQMWVYADVYENELVWVKEGEIATITLPSTPGKTLEAKVSYIYPFLQDQTRTAKVRIGFSNGKQELKKDMYVTVDIIPTVSIDAIAVPEQSVIHSGSRNIVVLSLGGGKFKPVDVTLGVLADGYYQVIQGVTEGDTIVTSSQFLIDSESNLKAGESSMQGMNMGVQQNKKDTTMKNMKMQ
ncbi:MAG TPA: efflux RND transporter periplasmic adaptor subunit [Bacteroidia bacterium]|jgi:Cu(I)/Ag(I) efflux system membrane fusion protein|nr:efflux RND transporter periplasmic adaptor subunit [Bacteroidia bacterium]